VLSTCFNSVDCSQSCSSQPETWAGCRNTTSRPFETMSITLKSRELSQWHKVGVDDLSSVADVDSALTASCQASQDVEAELDRLLDRVTASSSTRGAVLAGVSQIASVASDDAAELASLLETTSRTAEGASARIRFLGNIILHGKNVLRRVDQVLTLRVCAEGAKTALSAGDLASAANHVQTYLALDQDIRNDDASLSAVTQMNQSLNELSRKVREKADEVAQQISSTGKQEFSVPAVLSAMKLFVPIGLAEEGILRFASCVNDQIAREADANMRSLMDNRPTDAASDSTSISNGGENESHIVVLAQLFETVAAYLHDSETSVIDIFGGQSLVTLGYKMQQLCDVYCEKIFVRYSDARSLDQVVRAVRTESANARDLDPLLNELVVMSQRISAYFSFMKARCLAALKNCNEAVSIAKNCVNFTSLGRVLPDTNVGSHFSEAAKPTFESHDDKDPNLSEPFSSSSVDDVFGSSKLADWERSLTSRYVELEAYFMRDNVLKAIRIDELGNQTSLTSTAVDDFFFVLQKVMGRSLVYGGNPKNILVILHHMNTCIGGDLLGYTRRRLRETEAGLEKMHGASTSSSSLPSAALTVSYLAEFAKANISSSGSSSALGSGLNDVSEDANYDYFVALNNASVAAEYAVRFGANVEQSVVQLYGTLESREHLSGPLGQINDSCRALSSTLEQGLVRLGDVLTSRIAPVLERFLSDLNYNLSDDSLNLDDSSAFSFSLGFLDAVEGKVLHPSIEKRLTEANWDLLVRHVSIWAANKVEFALFLPGTATSSNVAKKFNTLGGLRADRDVRSLSAYFSGKCRRTSVRDVFARLSQIALLINLEQPSEVYDIWGGNAGGMTWRLSPGEVRRALLLRIDFKEEVVRKLKL
jgi:conserved oligomeric Golgi complex subunit 4